LSQAPVPIQAFAHSAAKAIDEIVRYLEGGELPVADEAAEDPEEMDLSG